MSEDTLHHFQFNKAVKLRASDSRLSADAGVLILREAEQKLGVIDRLAHKLHDPRAPERIRYHDDALLRERLFALALGHPAQDDLDRLAHDPAFRAACWNRPGERVVDERLASQPSHARFIERLADPEHPQNLQAIRDALADMVFGHQRAVCDRRVDHGVVDTDGLPLYVHGRKQQGAAYSGYYGDKVYNPLAAFFSVRGDFQSKRLGEGFIHAALREGDAAPAQDARDFLRMASAKARELAVTVTHRVDAGFADAKTFNMINDELGDRFVCRLPHNMLLDRLAEPYLRRPSGRPPKEGYEFAVELAGYQNPDWTHPYRVVLVVVDLPQEDGRLDLGPRFFFLVTNIPAESMAAWDLLEFYRQRGTFEDRLGEWNGTGVRFPHASFRANEALFLLSLLAFNLCEALRGEFESAADPREHPPATPAGGGCDLERLRRVVLRCAARVVKGGRRLWFDVASGVTPLWQALLERIERWTARRPGRASKADRRAGTRQGFMPSPAHAYRVATYRM